MKISDISIKRPVFAIVLNILIILLGLVGLTRMSIREYPNIDLPVISIRTTYSGASPEIIETQVTKAIEDAVTSIDGIDFMTSMSRRGMSFVNISFQPSKNIEEAANDVRDRVARAKYLLPDDVDEPIINKSDSDADPVMILTLTSDKLSSIELTKIVENNIKPQVELLEGVSNLEIWGGRDPVMRVWLDPEKMSAFDIAITDIEAALRAQNVEIPAGSIKSNARELDIVAQTDLNTVDEFNNIIVKTTNQSNGNSVGNQHIVRLGDLASVELGGVEETSRPRMNGKRGVGIAIIKQSVANPLTISSAIREVLPTLQESLPDEVNLEISSDNSIFINKSLQSVYSTIIEALIFVGIIIFFFLRDWRVTIVPMVTVPIALVGTLFAMYLLGYSINTLTMLAFVLAIGLVVDDAIVMLENIHRHIEAGLSPIKAAFVGSKEIGLAIIAMTITLAAVFLPLTFTEGRIGKLFIEFAVTLSIAVIISGFTALTLSPMMCSRLLKSDHKKGKLFNAIENMFVAFTNGYTKILRWVLPKSFFVIIGMLVTLGASYFIYMQLPQMLAPTEDRGFIRVSAITPEGATVDFTDRYFTEIEDLLLTELPKATVFVVSGVASGGIGNITLEDWDLRSESQMSIVQRLNQQFKDIALGLRVFASNPQSLGQDSRSKEVEVVIRSTASFEELDQYVTQIMQTLNNDPRLVTPDNNLRLNTPQLEVDVDREKLALLGIDVNAVGRALETALGGRNITRFKEGSEQYDVLVQVEPTNRNEPRNLKNIYVRSNKNQMIPLSNFVTIRETVAPQYLNHFNKLRSVTISANLAEGISQGDGINIVEDAIREVMPDTMLDYTGGAREFKSTGNAMVAIFLLALMFIYLVMAAQFESWIDPFIILLSVPLAALGALLTLYLTGNSMNIYSQIGLVTLVGLITKHGILLVEFANQLQDAGKDKLTAIIESASLRLRPILMTTGAMVLGSIPLALATGAGAESRSTIGWVIVGGLCLGTLLTVFIVPSMYLLLSRHKKLINFDHE